MIIHKFDHPRMHLLTYVLTPFVLTHKLAHPVCAQVITVCARPVSVHSHSPIRVHSYVFTHMCSLVCVHSYVITHMLSIVCAHSYVINNHNSSEKVYHYICKVYHA